MRSGSSTGSSRDAAATFGTSVDTVFLLATRGGCEGQVDCGSQELPARRSVSRRRPARTTIGVVRAGMTRVVRLTLGAAGFRVSSSGRGTVPRPGRSFFACPGPWPSPASAPVEPGAGSFELRSLFLAQESAHACANVLLDPACLLGRPRLALQALALGPDRVESRPLLARRRDESRDLVQTVDLDRADIRAVETTPPELPRPVLDQDETGCEREKDEEHGRGREGVTREPDHPPASRMRKLHDLDRLLELLGSPLPGNALLGNALLGEPALPGPDELEHLECFLVRVELVRLRDLDGGERLLPLL